MSTLATMLTLFEQLTIAERQALKTVIDSKISLSVVEPEKPAKKERKPRTVDPTKPKTKPDNAAYLAWNKSNGKAIREAFAASHPDLKGPELTKGKNQAVKDAWAEAKKTIKPAKVATSSSSLDDIKADMSDDDVDSQDAVEIDD